VHLNRAALWAEETTLTLGLPDSAEDGANAGSYSVGAADRQVEACALRLDSYVNAAGFARLDLIKMDIEGAEPQALAGAREAIARFQPTLLMEINREALEEANSRPEAIWDLLSPRGYRAWHIGYSAESSHSLADLSGVDRANVIFHVHDLPETVTTGWDLRTVLRWARSGW
jgi:hypothetical protein